MGNGTTCYECDSIASMCDINARRGDYARVGLDTYVYNGGSWTKVNIANYDTISHVERKTNSPVDKHERKRIEYFDDCPVIVGGECFYNLGNAFYWAWMLEVKYIWLNGKFINGSPHIGDTFEVRNNHWKVADIRYKTSSGSSKYLLERMSK